MLFVSGPLSPATLHSTQQLLSTMVKASSGHHCYEPQPPKCRRQRSNINERKRNRDMNAAFDLLQNKMSHIPMLPPSEKQRLSKIRTLRLAFQYIDFLKRILNDQNAENSPPRAIDEFANVVRNELTIRNSYSERAEQEQHTKSPQSSTKSSPASSHSAPHYDNVGYGQFYDLRHYDTYSHHHC